MNEDVDYTFRAMGSDVRLLIGRRFVARAPAPLDAADREREFVLAFAHRLSRFIPDSELSALNGDRRSAVPASDLLRAAARAGLWAAERSGGLVDPTLVPALRRNGYSQSLDGAVPASLREALAAAPPRRPARPDPQAPWQQIEVDDERGMIVRPPGLMLDTGGTGKGLCADAVAYRLGAYSRFVVDCGGDIAVGGIGTELEPYRVQVEHPLIGSVDRIDLGGTRRRGHIRRERPHLARPPQTLRPPPARPEHRHARLDWTDLRNGARLHRARGRDPVKAGAAARPGRGARSAAGPRRGDRPRRRRGRAGRSGRARRRRRDATMAER